MSNFDGHEQQINKEEQERLRAEAVVRTRSETDSKDNAGTGQKITFIAAILFVIFVVSTGLFWGTQEQISPDPQIQDTPSVETKQPSTQKQSQDTTVSTPQKEEITTRKPQPAAGSTKTVDLGGGVKMEFAWIPAGEFMMGSPASEKKRDDDEKQHPVEITRGFWLGKYEVTNEQYRRYKRSHDSGEYKGHSLNGDTQPVVRVSWEDVTAYSAWLSKEHDMGFRLPTEAEWEYACRAGKTTAYSTGNDPDSLKGYANGLNPSVKKAFDFSWDSFSWEDNYKVAAPVGSFNPNTWGLYDMHGNVWEWCSDWHDEEYYSKSPRQDPKGANSATYPVLRGGSWLDYPGYCLSAYLFGYTPPNTTNGLGVRLVLFAH